MNSTIRKAFNQAANTYDDHSEWQQSVGQQLLDLLQPFACATPKIADLGCGTGILTEKLAARYPHQTLYAIDFADDLLAKASARLAHTGVNAISADFDALPKNLGSFDLIFSNIALHWSAHLEKTLGYLTSQLNPDGILAFSIPLIGSLKELQPHFSINTFPDGDVILRTLTNHPCEILASPCTTILLRVNDALSALKSFKHTGTNTPLHKTAPLMRGKSFLEKINIRQLTYHIGYFVVKRSMPHVD